MNPLMGVRYQKLLMATGTVGLVLALTWYQEHVRSHRSLDGLVDRRLVTLYALTIAMFAYAVGLPDRAPRLRGAIARAFGSSLLAAAGLSLLLTVFDRLLISRFIVTASPLVAAPWLILCTRLHKHQRNRGLDLAIGIGTPDELATIRAMEFCDPERDVHLLETLDTEAVRTTPSLLVRSARQRKATLIVLGRSAQGVPDILEEAALLHSAGVRVRSVTQFYDEWLGKLPVADIASLRLMFDVRQIHDATYARIKRIVDVSAAMPGLMVCLALSPLVGLANLFGDRGPLFYRQERVGFEGRPFVIWKFRSMRSGAASTWTSADDDRITGIGRLLRRTHLDELPQSWNLLRGDLSLVGPRPEQLSYVSELTTKIPHYGFRHLARPGLTGWAQVKYRYGASEGDSIEKLEYDLFYVRHQSFRLDMAIVLRTFRHLVLDGGR
jgi:lipopolysaccharide/colanic/teichoic acid biosynthesis glycosyltransferase